MARTRKEKDAVLANLRKKVDSSAGYFFADFRGLTVEQFTDLRRALARQDSEIRVVKNTLMKLALKEKEIEGLADILKGPTALTLTGDDPVAAAKVLYESVKGGAPLGVKGAFVEGVLYDSKGAEALSKLPSKPDLYAKMLGSAQAPAQNTAGVMHAVIQKLVRTVSAVADQKKTT